MRLLDIFRKPAKSGLLGIEVSPYGIALAWIDRPESGSNGTCQCHYIEGNDLAENGRSLKKYLSDCSLDNMPAHVVLHPAIYHIHFIDRPEVEDEELDEAVRWKIKDLVDVPVKDLVIDAFALPGDAYRGGQKKVYAVTIERELLQEIVSTIEASGADIKSIGISELAVSNVVSMMHDDVGGAVMLRMRNSNGTINLSDAGDLYLTRQIESGVSMLETSDESVRDGMMENFLLEIQRSLDYYDNQLGKGGIKNFLMAPTRVDHHLIEDCLRDQLGIEVRSIDVNDLFEVEQAIPFELQSNCFAAIGAACGEHVGSGMQR